MSYFYFLIFLHVIRFLETVTSVITGKFWKVTLYIWQLIAKIVRNFPRMMRERWLCRLAASCLQPNTLEFQIAAKPRMNCWHFLYLWNPLFQLNTSLFCWIMLSWCWRWRSAYFYSMLLFLFFNSFFFALYPPILPQSYSCFLLFSGQFTGPTSFHYFYIGWEDYCMVYENDSL